MSIKTETFRFAVVSFHDLCISLPPQLVYLTALPKPPASLIVTETTATSVTLTWDSGNPEPVSYYIIQYRAKVSDNSFQEVRSNDSSGSVC